MIVICLTDCPPKLRGDLTKWLAEINTGVYVGNLSARVREELWERICKNLKDGQATMVYSSSGEQKMAFRVAHSPCEPVDMEGITLMRRPLSPSAEERLPKNFSHAAHRRLQQKRAAGVRDTKDRYFAAALTASGKTPKAERITEIAAARVEDGEIQEHILVRVGAEAGASTLSEAMAAFLQFIGTEKLVLHDAALLFPFIRAACQSCGQPVLRNPITDTLLLARRRLTGIRSFDLSTVAERLELIVPETRDAGTECELTARIYEKLKYAK